MNVNFEPAICKFFDVLDDFKKNSQKAGKSHTADIEKQELVISEGEKNQTRMTGFKNNKKAYKESAGSAALHGPNQAKKELYVLTTC